MRTEIPMKDARRIKSMNDDREETQCKGLRNIFAALPAILAFLFVVAFSMLVPTAHTSLACPLPNTKVNVRVNDAEVNVDTYADGAADGITGKAIGDIAGNEVQGLNLTMTRPVSNPSNLVPPATPSLSLVASSYTSATYTYTVYLPLLFHQYREPIDVVPPNSDAVHWLIVSVSYDDDDEYLLLRSYDDESFDPYQFKVVDWDGHTFFFPHDTISPTQTTLLRTGQNCRGDELCWGSPRPILHDQECVRLYDRNGRLLSYYGDENECRELIENIRGGDDIQDTIQGYFAR